ncbi:hypothetical protein F5Y08DRAFT_348234 [Xylaria arbuscula]|nr:hypothetical protein F5Y08DRAFT_348234 [Xylaria arbuscula]
MSDYRARDIQRYNTTARTLGISLGGLNHLASRATIENAISRLPNCRGVVDVYWPHHEPAFDAQQNSGWCHLVCGNKALRHAVWEALVVTEWDPDRPRPRILSKIKTQIEVFGRIRRVHMGPRSTRVNANTASNSAPGATPSTTTAITAAPIAATPVNTNEEERLWWKRHAQTSASIRGVLDANAAFLMLPPAVIEQYRDILALLDDAYRLWGSSNISAAATIPTAVTVPDAAPQDSSAMSVDGVHANSTQYEADDASEP